MMPSAACRDRSSTSDWENVGEVHHNDHQVHRGIQHGCVFQHLAMEDYPLPKSWGQAMLLIQALLQSPDIVDLVHRYAQSFSGEHFNSKHLSRMVKYRLQVRAHQPSAQQRP